MRVDVPRAFPAKAPKLYVYKKTKFNSKPIHDTNQSNKIYTYEYYILIALAFSKIKSPLYMSVQQCFSQTPIVK